MESDPATLGWMRGAPPPPERIIRFEDGTYFEFPAMRWSVANFRQLMPTVAVSRGLSPMQEFAVLEDEELNAVAFYPWGSTTPMTWKASLLENYTDGILILHQGTIVYERYFGVLSREGHHGAMSLTKSVMGLLAMILMEEGLIDPDAEVQAYIPELAASAFGNASVREVLDMTTGIRFSEDYADPQAEIWAHAKAGNPLPKPADYEGPRSYYAFLQTVQPEGSHGAAFHYRTANTDVLGWILSRVSGMTVAELLSERIWRKMGAEQDAYMSVDSTGTPFAGGGLSASLRDLARLGELIRIGGSSHGLEIVPTAAINDLRAGGSQELFAKAGYSELEGWSYRNMWWITHNAHGAFMGRGVHGQSLYIDPTAEMVIARFASHPIAANAANDPTTIPAYEAIAAYLLQNKIRPVGTE